MFSISPKAMSKRIFGIGILSVGLLVLTVALILGLEFPKYVFERNVEHVCILNKDHKNYRDWLEDSFRDKSNSVYYWLITNPHSFMYENAQPQVEQRGPYIYRESIRRVDVRFVMNTVRFLEWKQQTFDEKATSKACPSCREDDKLTVINPHYLQMMEEFGGDVQYTLHIVPGVMSSSLQGLVANYNNNNNNNSNVYSVMELLGQLTNDPTDQWQDVLRVPQHFGHFGFGNWVGKGDTPDKNTVLNWRNGQDFTSSEMIGLYFVLTNTDALGVSKIAFTNNTFLAECREALTVPNYATYQIDLDPGTLTNDPDNVIVTSLAWVQGSSLTPTPCGLVLTLKRFQEVQDSASSQVLDNLTRVVEQYLCPNASNACLTLPPDLTTRTAFVRVLADYVFLHMLQFVFHTAVILAQDDLVATKVQRDMALGYTVSNGTEDWHQFVPGILQHASDISQARKLFKQIELFNCYDSIDAETNFMWSRYDKKTHASVQQFPAASERERQVRSYRHHMQPLGDLRACASYHVDSDMELFVPEFWRRMLFSREGSSSLAGVSLDKLRMNASNLEQDDIFVFTEGLQEMTLTNGYTSWVSLPHFLHATEQQTEEYDNMAPDEEQHSSFVEWEAIGGEMWRSSLRHQLNVGILDRDISVRRSNSLALNYTDQPIPAFWIEQHFRYSDRGIEDFKHRVTRLLSTSCGGLVGLSTVAVIIMICGVLAGTITIRSGKVAPITDDVILP